MDRASRPARYLIATVLVALYVSIGYVLRLNVVEYQLAGIPLLLFFQLAVRRLPIQALWVRSAPAVVIDRAFLALWAVFSLVPAYELSQAAARRNLPEAAFYGGGIAGAFGVAYALRAFHRNNLRQLAVLILVVVGIGILPSLMSLILPHVLHVRMRGPAGAPSGVPFSERWPAALVTFLMLPAAFVVEEVFFRGALDSFLHGDEKRTGWPSAIYVSALWGLWHLPGSGATGGRIASTAAGLIVAHVLIGVPLSIAWRKSGNLVVPATAHALLDAARGLIGT